MCTHQSDVISESHDGDSGVASLHVQTAGKLSDEIEHSHEISLVDASTAVQHEYQVYGVTALCEERSLVLILIEL